jgi:hypothetical protein
MKISDVEVSRHSEHSEYSLSWRSGDARYHVWLSTDGRYDVKPCIGNKTRSLYKTPENGAASQTKVSQLDINVPKNKAMFQDAMAEATAQHLFEKCNADLLEREQKMLAKCHAEYLIELQHKAGPEMFTVLKQALIIVPMLKPETCVESDRANLIKAILDVVRLAEQGEGVPL